MLPSIKGSQNCNPPVSSPWAQERGRWCLTSQEGLARSARPPRRGCRPPPGRAGGSQGSTRWGCSLSTVVLTTTREGRTLEFLKQLDFRTLRLILVPCVVFLPCQTLLYNPSCQSFSISKVYFCWSFLKTNWGMPNTDRQTSSAKQSLPNTDLLCKAFSQQRPPLQSKAFPKQRPPLQRFSIQGSPLQTNIGEEKEEEGVILHVISDYIVVLDVIQWEVLHCL